MSKSKPVSGLEAHLGYWLRCVSNQVSQAFQAKVEAQGVTVAEWVVLRTLFDTPQLQPSQLAAALGMTRGAISKLVERLTRKALVVCQVDSVDRRYQSLTLTAAGRKLVPQLAALADQNDAEFFGGLSETERIALRNLLQTIVRQRGLAQVPVE